MNEKQWVWSHKVWHSSIAVELQLLHIHGVYLMKATDKYACYQQANTELKDLRKIKKYISSKSHFANWPIEKNNSAGRDAY